MIHIDPNVRIEGNRTYSYVSIDQIRYLWEGDAIVVDEPECGAQWPATIYSITRTDDERVCVVLDVAWEKGKVLK